MADTESAPPTDGSVTPLSITLSWGSAAALAGGYVSLYSLDQLLSYGDVLGTYAVVLQFVVMGVLVAVHEGIHAISFMIFGGLTWDEIRAKTAVNPSGTRDPIQFYVYPKVPISKRAYALGVAMPGVALGILPSVAALVTGSPFLMALGIFGMGMTSIDVDVLFEILFREGEHTNTDRFSENPS
jgi:hypothetical protein